MRATLTAYPAPEWSALILLRGAGSMDLASTPDGVCHVWDIDASVTEDWVAGEYWYSVRVTDGDAVVEVDEGNVTVTPDFASLPAGYDGRNHNRRMLEAIEARLEGRATTDQERYRIGDRELYRIPIAELRKWHAQYRALVAADDAAAKGRRFGRDVKVVM